jgi:hypothetical protein
MKLLRLPAPRVLGFLLGLVTSPLIAADFYVAPNAVSGGNGSLGNPWKLQTALDHPSAVHPGDTIWLRGGTYSGTFISDLAGSSTSPIIVRQYPGERATLDGGAAGQALATLAVTGKYTWYWGFEIMSSDPDRISSQASSWPTDIQRPDGIQIAQSSSTGAGLRFINLIVHDTRQGISFWKEAVDAEIHGCLVYYQGWQGPDRGHGHGIYTQNETGTKKIVDNIVFEQFGGGIQAYGQETFLNNFHIEGNTLFENGSLATTGASDNLLVGGGVVTHNDTIKKNMLFYNTTGDVPDSALNFGYDLGCSNGTVTDNYFANNSYFINCHPVSMTGNTFYGNLFGLSESAYPSNTYLDNRPATTKVFVRPNAYETGRANITIFNWALQSSVAVNLDGVAYPGGAFEIRNAQNFFGAPVVTGVFSGGTVNIPMTGLVAAAPVGWSTPTPTAPELGVFVLRSLPGANEFFDVPPSNMFHDAVVTAAANGITAGCGNGNFCPTNPVTRAQMSVLLLKSKHGAAYVPPAATGTVFSDVPASAFAAAWIERLKAEGLTNGCGGTKFCPAAGVTRAQMAIFLLKGTLGSTYLPPAATGTVFTDVPANGFAAAWIEELAERGLTSGCGGGKYCPASVVSRAQMAAFLVNSFSLN